MGLMAKEHAQCRMAANREREPLPSCFIKLCLVVHGLCRGLSIPPSSIWPIASSGELPSKSAHHHLAPPNPLCLSSARSAQTARSRTPPSQHHPHKTVKGREGASVERFLDAGTLSFRE